MQSCNSAIKKYKRVKEQVWVNIIRDYEQSGMSIKQFCDTNQISPSGLRNWRYKFKKQEGNATSAARNNFVNFVPVKIDAELKRDCKLELANSISNKELKIELRSNVKIIVPDKFDDNQLLRLINLLQQEL